MYTRRVFLKTTIGCAAGGVLGWRTLLRAADPKPLIVREAKVIRVRDRQKGGPSDSYLEITSESGLNGYAGPLLKEQVAAFPANLRELLIGRDAGDPEQLNFGTLWAACHPGKTLESYVEGQDPLTGAPVWGCKRTSRQTETGWVITALSAIDLALWDLRGKGTGQPVWRRAVHCGHVGGLVVVDRAGPPTRCQRATLRPASVPGDSVLRCRLGRDGFGR